MIIETGRPRGRGTEKENNNNKAVGQVFLLTLSGFFFERTRANITNNLRTALAGGQNHAFKKKKKNEKKKAIHSDVNEHCLTSLGWPV